ncbi:MAG: RNA polymerase sigma factor [Ktedonobacteraceae bacterium]
MKMRRRSNQEIDQELVALLLYDLDEGFKRLVEVQQPFLQSVANNALNNDYHMAQDVVQDSLVKAYFALRKYRRHSIEKLETLHITAWLHKITYNTALDYYYIETEFWSLDPLEKAILFEEEGNRFDDPGAKLIDTERIQELQQCWQKLSAPQKAVLQLRYLQDEEDGPDEYKYWQIAQKLGYPLSTVKSHKRRGLERLRKALQKKTRTRKR